MGKTRPGPRVRMTIGGPMSLMTVFFLAACAHRDVVDTPVGWFHDLQGGAIAQQRPPPPGINDPYPKIGTTPAHAPVVASLDLRHSVTSGLLRQRNLTTRLDANDPIPPAVVIPAAPAGPVPKPAAAGGSSAMLDAAQAPNPAPVRAGAPATPDGADAEPELAMPAVQVQAADAAGGAVVLPGIPGAPPSAPHLPGLVPMAGMPVVDHLPDYRTEPATGTLVGFEPGTDTMLGGQAGALHAIAVQRGGRSMVVRGYGDAAAPDPEAQSQALSVAALRARTVAEALQAEGVPAKSILLRAEAFGRGASVSLVQ